MRSIKSEVSDLFSDCGTSQSGDAPNCKDTKKECCVVNLCGKPDTRPPFARAMPEGRRYTIVITREDPEEDCVNVGQVMNHIRDLVLQCPSIELEFSECVPFGTYAGRMLIVCEDRETALWVIEAIKTLCPPHLAATFVDFFGLIRCTVVLPFFEPRKTTCELFQFLERQNGVKTDMWAVFERKDTDSKQDTEIMPIEGLVKLEVLEIYIDAESKKLIESRCSKLKYMFWTVEFKFDCNSKS